MRHFYWIGLVLFGFFLFPDFLFAQSSTLQYTQDDMTDEITGASLEIAHAHGFFGCTCDTEETKAVRQLAEAAQISRYFLDRMPKGIGITFVYRPKEFLVHLEEFIDVSMRIDSQPVTEASWKWADNAAFLVSGTDIFGETVSGQLRSKISFAIRNRFGFTHPSLEALSLFLRAPSTRDLLKTISTAQQVRIKIEGGKALRFDLVKARKDIQEFKKICYNYRF